MGFKRENSPKLRQEWEITLNESELPLERSNIAWDCFLKFQRDCTQPCLDWRSKKIVNYFLIRNRSF